MPPARSFQATLDANETLFTLMAALNSCGYDQELEQSGPLRSQIRSDVGHYLAASAAAQQSQTEFCRFVKDHQTGDAAHNLAQYVSLALFLTPPPDLKTVVPESDLPPDASFVLGAAPLLQRFYFAANIQSVWEKDRGAYQKLIERFHNTVASMIFHTDIYLRLQMSGYLGRHFIVYLEPQIAPSAINARNYGDNYFLVLAPQNDELPMQAVRHTYLHYVLDPYALNHPSSLKRIEAMMPAVESAPMDESFKQDTSLFVTECLIRAIESRLIEGKGKDVAALREARVQRDVEEGFTLTRYFANALAQFERSPAGLKDSYDSWLYNIDVGAEKKFAENTDFASQATPELLQAARPATHDLLDSAELRLMSHDPAGAEQLAQQALTEKQGDAGRAFFVLARASAAQGNMASAQQDFERAVAAAHDPRVLAWSHIYLGRILDIKQQREAAVAQYQAALAAGDTATDTQKAAQSGLAAAYAPPAGAHPQPPQTQ